MKDSNTVGRTLFYKLDLCGVGTTQQESLRSFLKRLAFEHRMPVRKLLLQVYERYPCGADTVQIVNLVQVIATSGLSLSTQSFTARLELTTGTSLVNATFGRFSQFFAQAKGIDARRKPMYCPVCVVEGTQKFAPLIWEISCVDACPLHEVKLRPENICGDLGPRGRGAKKAAVLPGVCGQCGAIGHTCVEQTYQPASTSEVWIAKQIGHLFSLSASQVAEISNDSILIGLRRLVSSFYGGNDSIAAKCFGLKTRTFRLLIAGKRKPAFHLLLKFCLINQVEFVPLLRGDIVGCLRAEESCFAQPPEVFRKRILITDDERRKIVRAAAISVPPSTITQTLNQLGLTKFPKAGLEEEIKALRAAIKVHKDHCRSISLLETIDRLRIAVEELKLVGRVISIGNLQKKTGLRVSPDKRNFANEAFTTVLCENGVSIDLQ